MKSIKYYGTFMIVWITGWAIADYGIHLGADSWRMLWGAFVAAVGIVLGMYAERH